MAATTDNRPRETFAQGLIQAFDPATVARVCDWSMASAPGGTS